MNNYHHCNLDVQHSSFLFCKIFHKLRNDSTYYCIPWKNISIKTSVDNHMFIANATTSHFWQDENEKHLKTICNDGITEFTECTLNQKRLIARSAMVDANSTIIMMYDA